LLKTLRGAVAVLPAPADATMATNAGEWVQSVPAGADGEDGIAVYLAETTRDLAKTRSEIKNELTQFNYRVLPDQPLPLDPEMLLSVVRNCLGQAKLSVHLVGSHYGTRPEQEDRSIPHIQYDVAEEMRRVGRLTQLVWMPDGTSPKEDSQQKFVDRVKATSPDFLRTSLEDLKREIQQRLVPRPQSVWGDEKEDSVNVSVFCHNKDIESVSPLYTRMTLYERFRVKFPLKETESAGSPRDLLDTSDAVLLYYGSADEDWFVNIWHLIQRHVSAGRREPLLARCIYAG